MTSNTSFVIYEHSPTRKYGELLVALAKTLLGINSKIQLHDGNDFSLRLSNCSNSKPVTIPSYCLRVVLNAPREIDGALQEVLSNLEIPNILFRRGENDPLEELFGNNYEAILGNVRFQELASSIAALKPTLETDIKPKLIENTALIREKRELQNKEAQKQRNLKIGLIAIGGLGASYLVFKLINKE